MEYNINFQDNIMSFAFNDRAQGILDWIKDNREKEEWAKDPNAYELTNVFLLAAKYRQEREDIRTESLKEMWEIRSQDFEGCGVSQQSFIYKICEDSYLAAMEGKALVNDENSHHALRKMAGIGLWLKQQQRDGQEVQYNNPTEFLQLIECSKTLKTFHPELFESYRFEENIETIMKLQLQQDIPSEIAERLQQAQKGLQQNILEQPSVNREISQSQEK